jgi:O-antigen/teichoic acid export membrane protein
MYLSGAEVASKILTLAAIAYLGRIFGPTGYGYVEYAGAVLLCAGLIVDQGFNPYGAREIAKSPESTSELISEIVVARILMAVMAYVVLIIFVKIANPPAVVSQLILILGLSLFIWPIMLQWVFQGYSHMHTVAIIQLIRQFFYALVIFAFIRTVAQIRVAGVAEIVGVGAAAVAGVWAYRRQFGKGIRISPILSRRLFREGVPIGLSQMFWMIRMYGATVIIGLIASAQDVGFFGSAMRILIAMHAFVVIYFFNLLPSMAQAWQKGSIFLSEIIDRSLSLIAWVAAASGMIWVLASPIVIQGIYGPAFAPAGQTLQWLAGVFVAALLSGHYRYGLIAAGYQMVEMKVSAIGAAIAIVLIPLGYFTGGPAGAAMGLFIAEVIVWWAAWWLARKWLGLSGQMRKLIWPMFAIALATSVIWFVPGRLTGVRILLVFVVIGGLALVCDSVVRRELLHFASAPIPWIRGQLEKRAQNEIQ